MAISDTLKPLIDNPLKRKGDSTGFVGKGEFEIRLTEPVNSLNSRGALVNGLEELFTQTERSVTHQLVFLICSPWLSTEAFRRLFDSLKGRAHHLFIITHCSHAEKHRDSLDNTWAKLRTKFSLIGVGTLPREDGSLSINPDALHAKLYAVGLRPPTISSKNGNNTRKQNLLNIAWAGIASMTPIECFFGSANFTTAGLGQKAVPNMKYDPEKKWELIGRAADESGKRAIVETFGSLWKRADIEFIDDAAFSARGLSHKVSESVYQGEKTQLHKRRSSVGLVLITILLTSAAFLCITRLVTFYQNTVLKGKNTQASTEISKESKKSQKIESCSQTSKEDKITKSSRH